ncbi:MAG: hypothetical protein LBE78_02175 [Burkholderiaceae bacterium]|jgi:hypothetical protein|nr:hypothetical protein [Burkholderiaceae bacterium]
MALKSGTSTRKGAPNTLRHSYIDTKSAKEDCQKNLQTIRRECKSEDDLKKSERRKKQKGNPLSKILSMLQGQTPQRAKSKKNRNGNDQWIYDHCEYLTYKPGSATELFNEIINLPKKIAEEKTMDAVEKAIDRAKDKLENKIKKKIAKAAAKQLVLRGLSFLGGPVVAVAVNIALTVDSAKDLAEAAKDFPKDAEAIQTAIATLGVIKDEISEIENALDKYKLKPEDKNYEKYKKLYNGYNKDKLISDIMKIAAKLNPCVKARRCILVPFRETGAPAALRGNGCCPGQTGHHILPEAMFKECKNYKHRQAPTMCVEGANNSHATHGEAHVELSNQLKDIKYKNGKPVPFGKPITVEKAIAAGVESIQRVFPESFCQKACLKAQLRAFYTKLGCAPISDPGLPSGLPASDDGQGGTTD